VSPESEGADVFGVEEEAERAVAAMAVLIAPLLRPFSAASRKLLVARVLARVAAQEAVQETTREPDATIDVEPPILAIQPAQSTYPLAGTIQPRFTYKDRIEMCLAEHPGATAADVGEAVYPDGVENRASRARALLHQMMMRDGRVRLVPRLGGPGQWEVVPLKERR
jgi:hypothetical protein